MWGTWATARTQKVRAGQRGKGTILGTTFGGHSSPPGLAFDKVRDLKARGMLTTPCVPFTQEEA